MDARLIPSVLDAAKKVVRLQKLKEEFNRVNILLQYEVVDEEDNYAIWKRKKIVRYLERIAENVSKLEKELYG